MIKQYNGAKAERRSSRDPLPAGGYVAKILDAKVQTYTFGDMLVLSFDIAEGEHKDFFKKDYAANQNEDKKWRGTFRISIPKDDGSEKDAWSKAAFNDMIAVFEADSGFHWDWDEMKLKGRTVGVLFRNKEWEWEGRQGWTTECCALTTATEIRNGDFKQPKDKPLKKEESTTATSTGFKSFEADEEDGELPF